jgi:tripartite-type tricarboxylate transporter receptor subunit TctC
LSGVALKDARPDGDTLGQIHTGTFRAALMTDKPAYDPLTDFTYIIQLSGSVHGIVVRADSPWKTLEELIAAAKANPTKLNYGTFGPASVQNLTMVDLQQRLGIELTHVPYRGGSELYQGLLGSQIDVVADASGWIPLVQSGQFRLLVVWGSKRMALFPEVRTLKEAGIDLEVNSPYGVCGPKGMDPAVVKKIHDAMKEALYSPEVQAVMDKFNMPVLYLDTAAYDKAARAQDRIERDNLKRVGMLGKQ